MLPLIVNLRGNSGSGKTCTTRAFMEMRDFQPTARIWEEGKPPRTDYLGSGISKRPWAVLGSYSNTCGGVDTIKTQAEIIARVEHYTSLKYNVWLEGLILSTIYGSVGAYSEKFGDRWLFCYLQPPIEECIRRIKARRATAGNLKPLNETNTRNRVATIERNKEIVRDRGRRVIELDWRDPLPALLKIIRKEGA